MTSKNFLVYLALSVFLLTSKASAENECFEKVSRGIFKFNMGFDRVILKPIATGYNKLPEQVRKGTGNFTSNIATLLSVPNHLLQGNFKGAGNATGSFLINTTIGILGFGNPAAAMGLENQKEDVGQTLGSYGVKQGCYFVLPVFGPTTARDSFGMIADSFMDPFAIVTWRERELLDISGSKFDYLAVKGTTAVDFRGNNMTNFESLEKNSIDIYASMKSIYLQDRLNKVNNSDDTSDEDWGNLDK
ncbi:VacJ family lipoprotein [Pelagibacteraceae bacterium]|nr:VacJ family lipoprotein [Pelagibacteraceae bacterium]